MVGQDQHEGISHPADIYRSCDSTAASAAIEIAQLLSCQWNIARRGFYWAAVLNVCCIPAWDNIRLDHRAST